MAKILEDYLDWRDVEDVCFGETNHPHDILGTTLVGGKVLVQCFFPEASGVSVRFEKPEKTFRMKEVDKGFFAVLVPVRYKNAAHRYDVEFGKQKLDLLEVYDFPPQLPVEELDRFREGTQYDCHDFLGARPWEIDGVSGVLFSVWAPNAVAVSVVGDFNEWHDKANPMRLLWDSGVYELFVPGLKVGEKYKFSIARKDGTRCLKTDPYALMVEPGVNKASIVADLDSYEWKDAEWMERRGKRNLPMEPLSIYEVDLATFRKGEQSYGALAGDLIRYVTETGYTHVMLMPIVDHLEGELDRQPFSCYAPTAELGTANELQHLVDQLHEAGIGVIVEMNYLGFSMHESGLQQFDGTWLYEHMDPRQGYHPAFDLALYNYGSPQVTSFLISSGFFWAEKYHVDGIQFVKTDAALYLDYSKEEGQWLPNMYGGTENLEGIEFIKHFNSVFKKQFPDVLLLAEDDSGWPKMTDSMKKGGLGFDFKMNYGWTLDVLDYMKTSPEHRSELYGRLTNGMLYQYGEEFVQETSHKWAERMGGSLRSAFPGEEALQFANLRLYTSYLFTHPGKKLLFMGQDLGCEAVWNRQTALDWKEFEADKYEDVKALLHSLNDLYRSSSAMYEENGDRDSFLWLNAMSPEENVVAFMRSDAKRKERLVVVANFMPQAHEEYVLGVPYDGKYKEIFNSDSLSFGGTGYVNPRVRPAVMEQARGFYYSIKMKLAPLSLAVFRFIETK